VALQVHRCWPGRGWRASVSGAHGPFSGVENGRWYVCEMRHVMSTPINACGLIRHVHSRGALREWARLPRVLKSTKKKCRYMIHVSVAVSELSLQQYVLGLWYGGVLFGG